MPSRSGTIRALLLALLVLAAALAGCDLFEEERTIPPPTGAPSPHPVDQTPAWSPDGTQIAYHHNALWTEDTTDVSGLYILNLETDSTRLLVEGSARSPDWRPNGERLAFTTGNVYTIRPGGSDLKRVTEFRSSFFPRWSPDGRTITFGRSGSTEEVGVWFAHLKDSSFTRFGWVASPADWSPDGGRVVYQNADELWIADTSRTDSTQLTDNGYVANRHPAWSPNGEWIAWTPLPGSEHELWIMRADGSAPRKLADRGLTPAWGPNSERIVFARTSQESDYTALWMIRRDGSGLRQLTFPASSNQ